MVAEKKAKTEVKVKKGHRNFLKFTIMTTIFATIICVVLQWQAEKSQNPESIFQNQISNQVGAINSTSNMDNADFQQSQQSSNGTFTDNKKSVSLESQNKIDTIKVDSTKSFSNNGEKPVVNQTSGIDLKTIKPIYGNQFFLRLNNEELEKIGFQITDSSITYENITNGFKYKYGASRSRGYEPVYGRLGDLVDENGRNYCNQYSNQKFKKIECLEPGKNNHNFYPVYKTNIFLTFIFSYNFPYPNSRLDRDEFKMSNDTLLPIVFPSLDGVMDEELLWFVFTDELNKILSTNHNTILEEFKKYKAAKKYFPEEDLIIYDSPYFKEKSKTLKLSQDELKKLGFCFYNDSTNYTGKRSNYGVSMQFKKEGMRWSATDKLQKTDEEGSLAILVTDKEGNPILGGEGFMRLFNKTDKIEAEIPMLIPVSVKTSFVYKDAIFWFIPSEGFFNALPDSIGNDLRKEYNYIIAEDKSTLEKPECKYFEECKNTLNVSNFKVYPNPANNQATVSFNLPESIEGRITLVDLSGREKQVLLPNTTYSQGSHQFDLDLSTVPDGIYLIVLYSNKGIQTQRLIVVR
jgi:hypothetical protein